MRQSSRNKLARLWSFCDKHKGLRFKVQGLRPKAPFAFCVEQAIQPCHASKCTVHVASGEIPCFPQPCKLRADTSDQPSSLYVSFECRKLVHLNHTIAFGLTDSATFGRPDHVLRDYCPSSADNAVTHRLTLTLTLTLPHPHPPRPEIVRRVVGTPLPQKPSRTPLMRTRAPPRRAHSHSGSDVTRHQQSESRKGIFQQSFNQRFVDHCSCKLQDHRDAAAE